MGAERSNDDGAERVNSFETTSHWVDSGKRTALIVDRLSYYPIRYARYFTQVHPFTPEGREKMEAQRRAGRMVTDAWRMNLPEHADDTKVYGLLQGWLAQQSNRHAAGPAGSTGERAGGTASDAD